MPTTPSFLKKMLKNGKIDSSIESQLLKFADFLHVYNIKKINLTAKNSPLAILEDLIQESCRIIDFIDLNKVKCIADIGSGSGIVGIVLKIIAPWMKVYLVEVNNKKRLFLNEAIAALELVEIETIDLDWRTLTRKTELEIDFFVTRATFDDLEIIRMFRSTSFYKDKFLVYWASGLWQANPLALKFVQKTFLYHCGTKKRNLVLFGQNTDYIEPFLVEQKQK